MTFRLAVAIITSMLSLATASYGVYSFSRLRSFYKGLVVALVAWLALDGIAWILWWLHRSTSNSLLFSHFIIHHFSLLLAAWLAYLLGRKTIAWMNGLLAGFISISMAILVPLISRGALFLVLSCAGVLTMLSLSVSLPRLLSNEWTKDQDYVKVPYFWCLFGFLVLTSGLISVYGLQFLIVVKQQLYLMTLQPWVFNLPLVGAQLAFMNAIRLEVK